MHGTLTWFQNKKSKVSAHYVVAKNGDIYQMVKDADKAWHSGKSELAGKKNVNKFSIGIEIVGTGDDGYTDEQYKSVIYLCKKLMKKYDISKDRIVGHKDIAPGRKIDPKDFDWNRLFEALS